METKNQTVKFKILTEGARIPERKTSGSAGYDLYVPENTCIVPGRNVIKLGFAMAMPDGMYARIKARSGFSVKGFPKDDGYGYHDADVIEGTIDADFRGEVGVIVKSCDKCVFPLYEGTRIAQMIFEHYAAPDLVEVGSLDETDRGTGGYGSTGTN